MNSIGINYPETQSIVNPTLLTPTPPSQKKLNIQRARNTPPKSTKCTTAYFSVDQSSSTTHASQIRLSLSSILTPCSKDTALLIFVVAACFSVLVCPSTATILLRHSPAARLQLRGDLSEVASGSTTRGTSFAFSICLIPSG